jgi:hypothetical protein
MSENSKRRKNKMKKTKKILIAAAVLALAVVMTISAAAFAEGPQNYTPQSAGQTQLTDEGGIVRQFGQIAACRQNAHKDGQIIDGSGLFLSRRGQIHGDPADGELGPAVFDGGTDALPRFPHGRIGQTYNIKCRETSGEEAFRADFISGNSVQTQRTYCYDHQTAAFPAEIHGENPRKTNRII